jgi:acetolactate synthase regulatory subunit
MTEALIVARLRDRPGALERALGLLRRRAFAVRQLSVDAAGDGIVELVVRVDESRTPRERVRLELLGLADLVEIADAAVVPVQPRTETGDDDQ